MFENVLNTPWSGNHKNKNQVETNQDATGKSKSAKLSNIFFSH